MECGSLFPDCRIKLRDDVPSAGTYFLHAVQEPSFKVCEGNRIPNREALEAPYRRFIGREGTDRRNVSLRQGRRLMLLAIRAGDRLLPSSRPRCRSAAFGLTVRHCIVLFWLLGLPVPEIAGCSKSDPGGLTCALEVAEEELRGSLPS
jgi:hypothetical protein